MKKNTILLVIVLILCIAAIGLFLKQRSGTIHEELRDFTVKDTAAVVKIFMANKKNQNVLLERDDKGDWYLNKKHWARPDAIQTLLATMHDLEIRSPVAKAAFNNIIKSIASSGTKVEIYTAKGLLKTFYVGGPTQDQYGTFMYLENSSVPFIMHIPGFNGYLTPRFFVDENDWVVKSVFKLNDGELKSLKVVDREKPGFAFQIIRSENGDYNLLDENDQQLGDVSQDKILNYLLSYRQLNFEKKEKLLTTYQLDSLRATIPFRSIVLTDVDNKTSRIDLWRKPITEFTNLKSTEDGVPFPFDKDRMTASLNGDTSLIVVQYYSFEKLFRKPADFQQSNSRK